MITAGDLRHRIVVQQKVETADGYGGKTGTWQDYAELWAKIERQNSFRAAAEQITAGAVASQPFARVHVRASETTKAITTDMRIVHGTTFFNVVSPPQDMEGVNRILTIMVTQDAPT